jgi:site-specific DNA-methyltransferase (adenine-specific)
MNLVNEMLDKLPKEVWKNKNLKWLDPATGMGNFPIAVYLRLIETLKEVIVNEKECKKHILENMLYMSELNKKNVLICKQIFDINNEYKLNIYHGDSLKVDYNKEFGIKHFDIIIGNPPYQQVDEKGHSKGGGNNLYSKFIYKGYELLNKDGYLVFITPPTYFGVGRSNNKDDMNIRKDIFNNCNIIYINLEECNKYFPNIGSLFIYYIIQKKKKINEKLEVICKYDNKNYTSIINQQLLNEMIYIPYLLTNTSINICKKIKDTENKLKIFHSPDNRGDKKHVKKIKNDEFKYQIQATGVQVLYSSKPCKNQYDKKVLMSRSGYLKPFYDNGSIGVGGDCFCCLVETQKEGEYIIKLLESKLYTFYININKWSGFHHLSVLQDMPYIKIEDIDDEKIYKYFKLNEEEIKFVESIITKKTKNAKQEINIIKNNTTEKLQQSDEIIVKCKKNKSKSKNNEEVNIIENDEILTISKKISKSKINIISDNVILEEMPVIKVKNIIKKKVKTNTNVEL